MSKRDSKYFRDVENYQPRESADSKLIKKALGAGKKVKPERKATEKPNQLMTLVVKGENGKPKSFQISRDQLVRRAMGRQVVQKLLWLVHTQIRTESGRPVKLDHQWREVYADPSPDVRIIAPAQRGKTFYEMCKTFAQLDLGMSVGWVMPKDNKVQELVHGKLTPIIKNTPYLQELQKMSGGSDSVRFKTFGRYGKLYVVTAGSRDELTSFSADCMHIDERDFCNRSNLAMYPSRMLASPYRLTDEISTPTTEGNVVAMGQRGKDNIHSEFLRGDQRRYHSRCPHCGLWQILDWYDNVIRVQRDDAGSMVDFSIRDKDWSPGDAVDLSVCCRAPRCGRPFDRLAPGQWVVMNPGARIRSRWIESLASTMGPDLATMLAEFQASLGNPGKMEQFHNMQLGRPYSGGMLRFNDALFEACQNLDHQMLDGGCEGPCTIGIDVNRPWLDIQISRWKDPRFPGQQVKVWAGKINGDEDEVLRLIRKFHVVAGVIDNQPEARFAIRLQAAAQEVGCQLVRCKYSTDPNSVPMTVSEAGEHSMDPPRLITVNRTVAIDELYESMQTKGVVWFRDWREAIDGKLYLEFHAAERKLSINDAGHERFIWEGQPDHQLHAAVYDRLAGKVMEMDVQRDLSNIGIIMNTITHGGPSIPRAADNPRRDDVFIMRR